MALNDTNLPRTWTGSDYVDGPSLGTLPGGAPSGGGVRLTDVQNAIAQQAQADANTYAPRVPGAYSPTGTLIVAHRGGATIGPENTMEAFQQVIAMGVKGINPDVWQGPDGGFVVVHDTTMDRTTTGSGPCANVTQIAAQGFSVDAGNWFAPGWSNTLKIPTLYDVLRLCRDTGTICEIELKSDPSTRPTALTDLIATIAKLGMGKQCIISISAFTYLTAPAIAAAAAAGVTTYYIAGGVTPTVSTLSGLGVGIFGYDFSNGAYTSGYLAPIAAAGIRLLAWTIRRRSDWATAQAQGATAMDADEPLYAAGLNPYSTSDSYLAQTFDHGMITTGSNRGSFFTTNPSGTPIGWFTVNGQYGVLQGWGSRSARQNSISFVQRYETISSDPSRFGWIAVGAPSDIAYSDGGGVGNGYNCILRQNGQLQIYRRTGGTATQLATLNTAALSAKQSVPMRVDMNGTTVVLTRTDTGDSVTATDSTYTGGYWHLGVTDAAATGVQCSWSQFTLT